MTSGQQDAQFTVFDPVRANCGTLTIQTSSLCDFLYYSWKGQVDWNYIKRKGQAALRGGDPGSTNELSNNKIIK